MAKSKPPTDTELLDFIFENCHVYYFHWRGLKIHRGGNRAFLKERSMVVKAMKYAAISKPTETD